MVQHVGVCARNGRACVVKQRSDVSRPLDKIDAVLEDWDTESGAIGKFLSVEPLLAFGSWEFSDAAPGRSSGFEESWQ